jgi:Aldose 1-epimerase
VPNGIAATLSHVSKDGDQNFPGSLSTHVTYTLTDDNALRIDYEASTDKNTVINFTNHSYFNQAGNGSGSVEDYFQIRRDTEPRPVDRPRQSQRHSSPWRYRARRRIGPDHPGNPRSFPHMRGEPPQALSGHAVLLSEARYRQEAEPQNHQIIGRNGGPGTIRQRPRDLNGNAKTDFVCRRASGPRYCSARCYRASASCRRLSKSAGRSPPRFADAVLVARSVC